MRRLSGWVRRHVLLTNLIILVLVAGPGYLRLETAIDDAESAASAAADNARDLEDFVIESALRACEQRHDIIIILRQLVELTDAGGGTGDLTQIDGFDRLTPELQTYLRNLVASAAGSDEPSRFVRDALALLIVPTCEAQVIDATIVDASWGPATVYVSTEADP